MSPADAKAAVEFDQVSLTRDGVRVLTDLSLRLDESRVGLIGHNGSGKSSLVRLLNGLLPADSGQIRVHGRDPAKGPEQMSATVGFIFQNPDHQLIFPTVIEELTFGLRNQGLSAKEATRQSSDLLHAQGHADWAERPVHSLSEGQKQLVCIFSVLLLNPDLLILDEPFSALDLPTRYRLLDLLHELPQQIVMISHELDTLERFDRIIWLEQGRVHQDGPPDQVLPAYQADARARAATLGLGRGRAESDRRTEPAGS
ncbi:MAG: energy-coupling factor ABC transporter ATP-binding protein [Natronospirillum sp.]|uniref:energy-coupling factor ABC transporter ATP-binding protein n=1 Tax=Natronospirillum sp. TaxID=2812955 RepID=UPI0025DDB5BD|nr:ABC transporter ATP-binding protein [Natronospirillum sp.]MCH8550772.1 energy-coupling factor ABC transporter ATP-binding protein [Natronospirillum sp.]